MQMNCQHCNNSVAEYLWELRTLRTRYRVHLCTTCYTLETTSEIDYESFFLQLDRQMQEFLYEPKRKTRTTEDEAKANAAATSQSCSGTLFARS
jgi:protein-arginine kinase activator protein McsA